MHVMEKILVYIPLFTLFFATTCDWTYLIGRFNGVGDSSRKGVVIAFPCMTGLMTTCWVRYRHFPPSDLYESFMFPSWSFSSPYLILGLKNRNEWSAATAGPCASLTHEFATLGLPGEMQKYTPLVPASQSHWLTTHVSTTLLSYAASPRGSPLAISPPTVCFTGGKKSLIITANRVFTSWIQRQKISKDFPELVGDKNVVEKSSYHLFLNFHRNQLIAKSDWWSHRIISVGLSLPTVGIPSGSVWANEAWGSYRSRDPKETRSLVTRLVYAIHLHTRISNNWRGEAPAAVASTGFLLVWTRSSGVNSLGIGLHNHGWLTPT
uniref:Heme attachment to plastid cytochrome c n=1 Tax=Schizaea elegans TaxID=180990 RepID=A0A286QHB9_9MONI|nr:heme attachment to plastid cytochrome c [Schizaea elegans]YP_009424097.1 heme attachment to plastid cytochrome c [Schizaea elegans]APT65998.1 heme attachment to plastid cytochrome c [Schizaea elegans]APT65999.1 heme attachment to plastid cytochrome c [Schizaea elegans]